MSTATLIEGYETTADERSSACLAHVLQIVGWWIAPLIIFVVRRESKFVSFHALQALFLQICFMVAWFVGMLLFIPLIIGAVAFSNAHNSQQPPVALFLLMPLMWLLLMGFWVVMLTIAIVYGIKANRGEWAQYPIIGRWVRRVLHI